MLEYIAAACGAGFFAGLATRPLIAWLVPVAVCSLMASSQWFDTPSSQNNGLPLGFVVLVGAALGATGIPAVFAGRSVRRRVGRYGSWTRPK